MKERFVRAIQEQPIEKPGQGFSKLNIHIPIREQAWNYCIAINSDIRAITNSYVDFSSISFQIPHITLYMGYVTSEANYSEIMMAVSQFTLTCKPFQISFSKPYLKHPKRTYAFLDVCESSRIINMKRQLHALLNAYIEPLNWDVVEEAPHITIAYIKTNFDEVEAKLKKMPPAPVMNAAAIEVSFCGPYGSCLGSIRCFECGG